MKDLWTRFALATALLALVLVNVNLNPHMLWRPRCWRWFWST